VALLRDVRDDDLDTFFEQSQRVLEKCGFRRVGEGRGFANARGEEIDEVLFRLDA
jgi:RimJ/RimL family protein N-acetyltransferase